MINTILYTLTFIILFIGSYTDFKKREVADTINWGFLFIVLGIRGIYSINISDYWYFIDGIVGGLIFFAIACIMFYTGQWGGGDSKMLIGLGTVFGFSIFDWRNVYIIEKLPLIEIFLINVLIIGGIYGLIYSIVLAIKHWHKFKQRFVFHFKKKNIVILRIIILVSCILLLIFTFFIEFSMLKALIYALIIFLILSIYFYLFSKAVEESCMHKSVTVDQLTEGEWIVNDIVFDGKRITGPKDLGIDIKQIKELKRLEKLGKVDKILIKVGIPFVPSFLLAFLVTILFGNWFVYFI